MRTIEFTLPQASPLLNQIRGMAPKAYMAMRRDLANVVYGALVQSGQRRPAMPFSRVHIEIVRGNSGSLPDWDGLYGGLKPLLDTFVPPSRRHPHGLGLIEDDNPKCVVSLNARPAKTKRGEQWTQILIAEVPE
ncbi:hypothetical protein [Microbulbifer sp. ALW1]|uniref:hypothetical protein n=1 Tax=Microbulbifer sp. (strain ALW1) TaxID=1516059 RepID=UPI001359552E|nr:hypothetical protein [Microbulbifer sp. ALW1]